MWEYGNIDNDMVDIMNAVDMVWNFFGLLSFIWIGYGLYVLAKKMNIKNAWMWWIPVLQLYIMPQVAGLSFKKYILIPILIIIWVALIWVIITITIISGGNIWGWYMVIMSIIVILYIISYIYYIFRYINILSAISKRTWRGGWTTCGLFFVPMIMYPVVASKFKGLKEEWVEETEKIEEKKEEL